MNVRRWACAGMMAGSLAMAAPAWSQTYVGVTPPTVVSDPAVVPKAVQPAPVRRGNLALTGADIVEMVAIAAFGISAGALGTRMARRPVDPGPVAS